MAQRKRIGLVFSYNESWIAGTYYILNIIKALALLPSSKLPSIIIISDKKENFKIVKKETGYPKLEFYQYPFAPPKYSLIERAINKVTWVTQKRLIIKKKPKQPQIDFLYPNEIEAICPRGLKKVNWIPDFQEDYLPEYFSEVEINRRLYFQKEVVCKGDVVVFSSQDSLNDFNRIYSNVNIPTEVLPFAVSHPNFSDLNIEKLVENYGLPNHYFFVPNQFWIHKNHQIILDALLLAKEKGVSIHVAFSGKETDYRNKEHFKSLKLFVEENKLKNEVSFLGFLDRKVQLALMKNSIAIVQPSLFEGWSTVVEDAKALNKFLILSNIPVHKEQIQENVQFFDPHNALDLTNCLLRLQKEEPKVNFLDYQKNRIDFALQFLTLVNKYS